jgi:hypothetical protein
MSENCCTVSANLSFLGLSARCRAVYSKPCGGAVSNGGSEPCCCAPDGSSSLTTPLSFAAGAGATTLRFFDALDPSAVARFFVFLVVGLVTEVVACALREGLEARAGRRGGGDWEVIE